MATITSKIGPAPAERRLRREIGLVGLMFCSVGSIIGSGWLFGALNAAKIAGPASINKMRAARGSKWRKSWARV